MFLGTNVNNPILGSDIGPDLVKIAGLVDHIMRPICGSDPLTSSPLRLMRL